MSLTEIILSVLICIFILGGSFFIFAGILGLIRFPDVYCRMHATTKGPTLGIMLVMVASILFFATAGGHEGFFYSRELLVIFFILLTAPVGAHMLSKNAYRAGVDMWEESVQDDWKRGD
ncbi:MAG: monovalent cation/H(+) antiporter subunit G [Bacillota bacterium]|nr:monovalent cation/H(+) antiporter subunit G [Bacillota bacterium]